MSGDKLALGAAALLASASMWRKGSANVPFDPRRTVVYFQIYPQDLDSLWDYLYEEGIDEDTAKTTTYPLTEGPSTGDELRDALAGSPKGEYIYLHALDKPFGRERDDAKVQRLMALESWGVRALSEKLGVKIYTEGYDSYGNLDCKFFPESATQLRQICDQIYAMNMYSDVWGFDFDFAERRTNQSDLNASEFYVYPHGVNGDKVPLSDWCEGWYNTIAGPRWKAP